jgi:hypothetical protein
MVSLAKLLRIRQGIVKKYKNIGLEKFRLSIMFKFKISKTFLNAAVIFFFNFPN